MTSRLVLIATFLVCALQPVVGQRADPRREPGTAIGEAVRVLERKDYVAFLKTFVRPEELKELLAAKSLDDLAAEFGQKAAENELSALRAASKMKPTLNADGTRAEYRFDQVVAGKNRVLLVKIGEHWFIRD